MQPHLYVPEERASKYGRNTAQYLLDLDANTSTTFNFCGGMMFGVSLSQRLKDHLGEVAEAGEEDPMQPVIYGPEVRRMSDRPGHSQDAFADNVSLFHGREVRQAKIAAGGGGMLIHLSFAGEQNGSDPEGWTEGEVEEYAGWLSDRQRRWRDHDVLQNEGFATFGDRFGNTAFTLHHKFYLHVDGGNNFWLSAEDGCEGVATPPTPPAKDYGGGRGAFSLFK